MLLRACPPMAENDPPTYTVVPLRARVFTYPDDMPGFHEVALFVLVLPSSAAIPFRAWPPMCVNPPPAYTVLPLTASASTALSAFGSQDVTFPVARSIAAR